MLWLHCKRGKNHSSVRSDVRVRGESRTNWACWALHFCDWKAKDLIGTMLKSRLICMDLLSSIVNRIEWARRRFTETMLRVLLFPLPFLTNERSFELAHNVLIEWETNISSYDAQNFSCNPQFSLFLSFHCIIGADARWTFTISC